MPVAKLPKTCLGRRCTAWECAANVALMLSHPLLADCYLSGRDHGIITDRIGEAGIAYLRHLSQGACR